MTRAYYNEIDAYAAQWLRNLIEQDLIADGDVDTRSISDVTPNDVKGYTQCHFFAGLGGWPAALRCSGVWQDYRPVWTGSCPCQPFSVAGRQGGFADERHLWPHFRYLIAQCRPATVLGEQVASASEWIKLVRGDLEAMEYAVGAIPIEAASAGADHLRDRYWFVGHSSSKGLAVGSVADQQRGVVRQEGASTAAAGDRGNAMADTKCSGFDSREPAVYNSARFDTGSDGSIDMAHANGSGWPAGQQAAEAARHGGAAAADDCEWVLGADGKARRVKSGIRLLADGVPQRVAKLRAFGNAIDLRPATAFIQAVSESLT